jgi:pilus assembly protein CpaE
MKDKVRVVLVDPKARSRQDLQRQFAAVGEVDLIEVCHAYQAAIKRIAALVPDLAVVVVDDDVEQSVHLIETLSASHPGVVLLPAGSDHNAELILRVVRAGAREFLPLPATSPDLVAAVRRLRPQAAVTDDCRGPRGPQVVAVTGAAGGVGCTALAVNLATSLAKLSRRDTVLVDFDLLLGSLEESLSVIPDNSLEVVVRNLDDIDPGLLKRWLPRHPCGLYVLPHPVAMVDSARIDVPALRSVLDLLKETFDTVVIDTSKGLQASDFLAFEMADVILVVVQLSLTGTRNTLRLLQYLRTFGELGEKVRLVINRVNSPLSEISLRKAEELLKTKADWQVPNATKLFRPARTLGVPIDEVDDGAGSKAHQAILDIARELHPYPAEPARPKRRLFTSFF